MAINHRYLVGKEIIYVFESGTKISGFIVGVDKNVGITIVEKDNKKNKLMCLNGPSTKYFKDRNLNKKVYNQIFKLIVDQIKFLKYDCKKIDHDLWTSRLFNKECVESTGSLASCPYSGQ